MGSGRADEIALAIREIVRHPIWRREFVEDLTAVLQHDQSSIRVLACRAARLLDAVELAPHLRTRLADHDKKVCEAAKAALSSLIVDR